MKLTKTASGKTKIKMSREEWTRLGQKAGWLSKSAWNFDKKDDDKDDDKDDKKKDDKDCDKGDKDCDDDNDKDDKDKKLPPWLKDKKKD